MNTRYRITIVSQESVATTTQQWVPTSKIGDKTEYGYAPEVATTKTEEREIFAQTVDALDITSVIKAINQIEDSAHPLTPESMSHLRDIARNAHRYAFLKRQRGPIGYHIDHDERGYFFCRPHPHGEGEDAQRFAEYDDAVDAAMIDASGPAHEDEA